MIRPLTEYFKVVRTPEAMQNTSKRKLSLSKNCKTRTPPKSSKVDLGHSTVCAIDLVSDDDEMSRALDSVCKEKSNISSENLSSNEYQQRDEASNSSASTILYTPETPKKSQTPKSHNSISPGSRDKFFSPIKKRNVKIKSPSKVKKNLCDILNANKEENKDFLDACEGMDDKTKFLLSIINTFLSNSKLRPLLMKDSQDLLSKCMTTKKPGMRVVCRLYWRKEGWYRLQEIKQICNGKGSSINDPTVQDMINNLIENGILESSNCEGSKCDMTFEDFLAVLKLEELKSICKDLKLKANNKVDATECLRSFYRRKSNISSYFIGHKSDNASRVGKILGTKTGPCYRLAEATRQALYELYILMYLGMDYTVIREKKLELTLIHDKIKRECYPDVEGPLDDASLVFKNREDFKRYIDAVNLYEGFLAETDLVKKCIIIENVYNLYENIDETVMSSYTALPEWLRRFTPPYLYVKMLEAGLQELKKTRSQQRVSLALRAASLLLRQHTFRQHKRAEWYAEKALILDKFMSDPDEAARVLLEGLESPLPAVYADGLRPRARQLATRRAHAASAPLQEELRRHVAKEHIMEKNINAKHVYKLPMDLNKSRGKIKFETRTADGRVVQEAEEFCIDHYLAEGKYTHGAHWEGKIVTTIFFLLFWDVIYSRPAGARGVFLTHYQAFPLDLFLDSFYANRKELIEERLREIQDCPLEDTLGRMHATWHARPETELSGISRQLGWASVEAVARALGGRALAALGARLAARYQHCRSGFPDLTLWNPATHQVMFVEVKTDSDKPSLKQVQWMHFLRENGIDAEFCYVGVNTKRLYIPLAAMSAASAVSVIYLYCKNRGSRRKGYMDVNEKP